MQARWLGLVIGVHACTRAPEVAATKEGPAPQVAGIGEPGAPPTPAVAPATPGSTAPVAPAEPGTLMDLRAAQGDRALPPGPIPAFVVVIGGATIVAPADPAIPSMRVDGIWVLDDAATPPAVGFFPDLAEDFAVCACAEAASGCQKLSSVPAGTGPLCDCRVPVDRPDTSPEEYEDGEAPEGVVCESESQVPVSLVGGVLYFHGDRHDGCGGMNIYDVFSESEPMVATPVDLSARTLQFDGCADDEAITVASPPWPLAAAPECGPATLAKQGCGHCRDFEDEASVFTLHRGRLYRVENQMNSSGAGVRRWSSEAVTPANCPSAADPCGAPDRFPGLAEADDFWVASDGSRALRRGGGRLAILGGAGPVPRGAVGKETKILGVRWHADARLLISTIVARSPRPRAVAPCAADDGCSGYAGCRLYCQGGACVPAGEPGPVELAEADRGFVDSHGGSDWGNRCVAHLRARRFGAAQAACAAGLAIASKPGTRGALLYNLGVIARKTGDAATARVRFTESLAARPGNAAVVQALADLGPG